MGPWIWTRTFFPQPEHWRWILDGSSRITMTKNIPIMLISLDDMQISLSICPFCSAYLYQGAYPSYHRGRAEYDLDRSPIWCKSNTDRHTMMHTYIHNYGKIKSQINQTPLIVCLWTTGKSPSTQKESTQTSGKHANTTQKSTVRQQCFSKWRGSDEFIKPWPPAYNGAVFSWMWNG